MMILINNKTGDAYSNVSISEACRKMFVGRDAVYNWINKNKKFEQFNHWTLYFNEIKLKQKKGFALK